MNEVHYSRDELVYTGEVTSDDSRLDTLPEGFTDEYLKIKYSAEEDDNFILDRAVTTMSNVYANRATRNDLSRKSKGH